ncbi:hypothetical protein PRUB_a5378 [Pseudoalteromonas rubra]|uniref:Uncharacterized protein n=1 Tax=Pseudoalteromonas rubra TaxID=43658 RepID=A0A8T0CE49_9GAMM|nr:hypothetical protein PRUB_a5378 [Pseudoalteromonas rubra]
MHNDSKLLVSIVYNIVPAKHPKISLKSVISHALSVRSI